ncbi:putative cytochrome P450 [Microthyrium microscopicum]|uniref:Putative cytochrome P450 n=1 Tax=Microthyrium microscopicum TaxID=703497 RepID=A0A6A6U1B1_9PEZI|nr:putative cytochrome P450 [Microthyrium microscopicum]
MQKCIESDQPIPIFFAFRCVTVDIIFEYMFGRNPYLIDREDWGQGFYDFWRSLWEISPWLRQFPSMLKVLQSIPRWVLAVTSPKALQVMDMETQAINWTKEILSADPKEMETREHKTVIWELAHTSSLPPKEREPRRLAIDCNSTVAAGFETTGSALSHLIFGVLNNERIHQKLLDELQFEILDPEKIPSYQELQELPYFHAVIREGIRHSIGAMGRQSRVNPKAAMSYKGWIIPAGFAFGMSAYYILMDPEIYSKPHDFNPERWLAPDAHEKLHPYFYPFGKGTRSYVGQNLALAELHIAFATIMRRFPSLKLYNTTKDDVEIRHDFFAGMWKYEKGDMGLQVKG